MSFPQLSALLLFIAQFATAFGADCLIGAENPVDCECKSAGYTTVQCKATDKCFGDRRGAVPTMSCLAKCPANDAVWTEKALCHCGSRVSDNCAHGQYCADAAKGLCLTPPRTANNEESQPNGGGVVPRIDDGCAGEPPLCRDELGVEVCARVFGDDTTQRETTCLLP
ncbi:hypothetical protein AAVH_36622, partial [Aphelenchoides avenae]